MESKMLPKLRFKDESGQDYPEWEENKLKVLFNISAGGDISKNNYSSLKNETFKYPVYSNSIDNDGLYGYSNIYKVKGNTLTVTGRGNLGIAKVRYSDYYPIVRLLSLTPINNLNLKFFEENINNLTITNESTGVPQLTSPQLSNTKIIYPCLEEQTKIGNFFINLDEIIEKQDKKVEDLESFKKGLMQRIFNQELRFKDENGEDYPEWEEKKLGDICIFLKGNGLSKNDLSENGEKCILYGELYTQYKEVAKTIKSKTNIKIKNIVLSKTLDVLIPSSGETALEISKATCILNEDIIIGSDLNIIRLNYDNGIFLSYILNGIYKYKIAKLSQGSSIYHLYSNQLKNLKINLPSLKEQTKIANILSNLDEIIEKESRKLECFREFKKGLMQRMFV